MQDRRLRPRDSILTKSFIEQKTKNNKAYKKALRERISIGTSIETQGELLLWFLKMNICGKIIKNTVRVLVIIVLLLLLTLVLAYIFLRARIDLDRDRQLFELAKNSSVTHFYANASSGKGYEPLEIEATSFGAAKKIWYSKDDVSDYVKNGFIATEDREFYTHTGVNTRRTVGALFNYLFGTNDRYGASTITQQVVKNISGDNAPTPSRKAAEIIRALEIEKNYTKEEILELYLNIVPMSDNIVGVGVAADKYFDKEPDELTLAEAATIVGITNSPTRFDPRKHPDACTERRNKVLFSMLDMDFITKEEYEAAISEPLQVKAEKNDRRSWFVEAVIDDLTLDIAKKYKISNHAAELLLTKGGYNIYTTERVFVQKALEEFFENHENLPKEIEDGLNFAMCVCDSETGELVGIIGSAGEKRASELLNLATVPHPPGSCLKPLALYAPLIDEGRINWATVFDDVPTDFFKSADGYTEFPRNSPERYDGLITVKDALRLSKNTVAVRMYEMLGAERIFSDLTKDFRFDTITRRSEGKYGTVSDLAPSPLALGQLSYGVPLRTLTEAYTVFPSEGVVHASRSYLFVTDRSGNVVIENRECDSRVYKETTARLMNQLLMNVVADGTAKRITLKHEVDTAGKTGTSSDGRDKLFVGYTPYLTAGIWCGYPSSRDSVASSPHLEIWDNIMTSLHKAYDCDEHFSTEGLIYREYCRDSGDLPDAQCALDPRGGRIEYGYFTSDNLPTHYCERHKLLKYDPESDLIVDDTAESEGLVIIALPELPKRDFPKEITVTDDEYSYDRRKWHARS